MYMYLANECLKNSVQHFQIKPLFHMQKHEDRALKTWPVHAQKMRQFKCLIECFKREIT